MATDHPPAAARGFNATAILAALLALAYPLLSHASVALQAPLLQWLALCSFAAVPLVHGLLVPRLKPWLLLAAIAAALWLLTRLGGGQYGLYLPPLVFTGALAATFGLSLMPGRTPLVTLFASLARGALPPALLVYTRKLTLFWACTVGGIFAVSLYLTLFGPLWLWSLHTNFVSYVVIASVFVLEFFLRRRWFPELEHPSFWQYLRQMAQIRTGGLR